MVTFKDFSNKEKVDFLSDVMRVYLLKCQQQQFVGLCSCINYVTYTRGIYIFSAIDFMGKDIWNPAFAGSTVKCSYVHWWPVEDFFSRLLFLTRLIHIYSI